MSGCASTRARALKQRRYDRQPAAAEGRSRLNRSGSPSVQKGLETPCAPRLDDARPATERSVRSHRTRTSTIRRARHGRQEPSGSRTAHTVQRLPSSAPGTRSPGRAHQRHLRTQQRLAPWSQLAHDAAPRHASSSSTGRRTSRSTTSSACDRCAPSSLSPDVVIVVAPAQGASSTTKPSVTTAPTVELDATACTTGDPDVRPDVMRPSTRQDTPSPTCDSRFADPHGRRRGTGTEVVCVLRRRDAAAVCVGRLSSSRRRRRGSCAGTRRSGRRRSGRAGARSRAWRRARCSARSRGR